MISFLRRVLFGSDQRTFQILEHYPHPFDPCPGTPNCVIHSVVLPLPAHQLLDRCMHILKQMSVYKLSIQESESYIHAVFRIPLFGFKDDVYIAVSEAETNGAVLHMKSASRIGRGDLGVNARRIDTFINNLNQSFS